MQRSKSMLSALGTIALPTLLPALGHTSQQAPWVQSPLGAMSRRVPCCGRERCSRTTWSAASWSPKLLCESICARSSVPIGRQP
eukprot:4016227-Alexandrium_andersonii.AAC.1